MHRRLAVRSFILLTAATGLLAGCGDDSHHESSAAPDTTTVGSTGTTAGEQIAITMSDIKFDTASVTVAAGTAVEFDFTNTGKIPHDAFIGDHAAQEAHEEEMATMGTMDHSGMGGEHAITVQPGETGSLTYTFDAPGTYEIGCHQPGHYAAGMTITVIVT